MSIGFLFDIKSLREYFVYCEVIKDSIQSLSPSVYKQFCLSECCSFISAYIDILRILCEHVRSFIVMIFFVTKLVGDGADESSSFFATHDR